MTGQTAFTETEALLACMEDDEAEADRIVKDMYPGERMALADAAGKLLDICRNRCEVCGERLVVGDPRGYVATYVGGVGSGGHRIAHHGTCPLPRDAG